MNPADKSGDEHIVVKQCTYVLLCPHRRSVHLEPIAPVLGDERLSDTWYMPLVLPDMLEFL